MKSMAAKSPVVCHVSDGVGVVGGWVWRKGKEGMEMVRRGVIAKLKDFVMRRVKRLWLSWKVEREDGSDFVDDAVDVAITIGLVMAFWQVRRTT